MKKSLVLVLAMLMILSVALSACGPKAPADTGTPGATAIADKQELTVNLYQEIGTLDWQKCSQNGEIQIYTWIMEGLTRNNNGIIQPGMAEKWDISPDGLIYTFHLRDAKWTDGQPVKAQDFYYGAMRGIDPKDPKDYAYFLYDIVGAEDYNLGKGTADQVGIKVIDDKTIQFTLKTPVPYFDYLVSFPTFAPCRQDLLEKNGTKFNAEADTLVTNGPFKVTKWEHESEMDFAKNTDYWDAGNIKLEKVTGLMISDDQTEFNMYEAGELDHTISLTAEQKAALTKGGVQSYIDGSVWFFDFNCTDPVLKNVNIRKALTLAVDRQSFIDNVAKQPWKPAMAYVQPLLIPDADGKTAFRDKTPAYFKDNDIEGAKAALAQGLKELGLTALPKLKFMTNDSPTGQQYAQAFQEMWKKNLGVECEIEPVPSAVRIDRQHKHDFQISLGGWGPDYPDPMTDLDLYVTGAGNNDPAWSNAEYDKLIKDAKVETDRNKRFDMLHQAEDIIMQELPIGPLYTRYQDYALREYVKNFHRRGLGADIDFTYAYIEGKDK